MASLSVIRSPKLRLQTICCFAGGASSEGYAGLAVEFAYRTLKNDAEVFPDECRVSLRQLQCCVNTQRIQLFRQSASYSPRPHQLAAAPVASRSDYGFLPSARPLRKTVAIALLPTVHF